MKGIKFHDVILDEIMNTNNEVKNEIYLIFYKLIKENAIKSIIRTKYLVVAALRFMRAGNFMGKIR